MTRFVAGSTRRKPDYSPSLPSQAEVPEVSNTLSALFTMAS